MTDGTTMKVGTSSALLVPATLAVIGASCLQAPPDAPPVPPGEDSGGQAVSCEEAFGAAPDFVLCSSTETSCTFYTRLLDGVEFTCSDACTEFDSACLDGLADDDSADDKCVVDQDEDCQQLHEDQICVCALPPT
ncbi:MAG TPA: hypothetical protein VFU21_16480 [Kofleriaceae bacterium]|nr:hypothetical protein [Kofleriaceae bacterium]